MKTAGILAAAHDRHVAKCAHEAGHALVAIEAGFAVHTVEVFAATRDRDGAGGGVLCDHPTVASDREPTRERRRELVRGVYAALAGPVAECAFKGDSERRPVIAANEVDLLNLLVGSLDDVRLAIEYAAALRLEPEARTALLRDAYVRLLQWFLLNRAALRSVAAQLHKRGRLSESDVATAMNTHRCSRLFDANGEPVKLEALTAREPMNHTRIQGA